MKPGKIFTRANSAAVSIDLDVVQEIFGGPVFLGFIEHSSKSKGRFKKCPAIQTVEIDRWRLNPVVDLQSVRFVARAGKGLTDGGGSFADRKRFPVILFGEANQPMELRFAFEHGAKWQSRFRTQSRYRD